MIMEREDNMEAKFQLGRVVATPGASLALENGYQLAALLARHSSGDWGDLCNEDKVQNEAALMTGERLMSAYSTSKGIKLWVITEWDRSVTTILLPDEY